jgi:hypothetical protein
MNIAIAFRRALSIEGYKTLADVGFDGDYVTPYQITSHSADGPALVALHWADEATITENRETLERLGYNPDSLFNIVLSAALEQRKLSRSEIYLTQTFHLVPKTRSEQIPTPASDQSFDQVTRYEVKGRKVLALGDVAFRACMRHGIHNAVPVCHPSARHLSVDEKACMIADGLAELGF